MSLKNITKVTKNLKLLYVEDDRNARTSTLELLSNFFTDIKVGVNGQDGLYQFHQHKFDLIISDINMPKLNGIEMLEQIRQGNKELPIVFLSAYNDISFLKDAIRLNIDCYIAKPLQLENLSLMLKKLSEKILLKQERDNYKRTLEFEINKQTKELNYRSHFDELTSFYNRYSFFEDLKSNKLPIIFIIDINKFKLINEIYGTVTGSLVLKKFAQFVQNFIEEKTYKAYRISGDEFALIDNKNYIDIRSYEVELKEFFTQLNNLKIAIEDDTISLEVTLGISIAQTEPFECAKIALEYAKNNRKKFAIYNTKIDIRKKELDALVWKDKTKSAIEDKRIIPVYQPIVNKKGKITKHETLMRLQDKDSHELIVPYYFLDIAIKTGLYYELSSFIIYHTLNILKNSDKTLSLNFNYADITNEIFLEEIEIFLKNNSSVGKQVVFEILESENIANYTILKKFVQRFRSLGVQFAIDDFGSGFSNFEHVLEIEPDYIKIDGSLVKNIDTNHKSHILVESIVQFSHKLGIKVIAEYVHSKVIFDMLRELNVDEYQGFYFSQAVEKLDNEK